MPQIVLIALMVITMIVAPPAFMFGLALREQRVRAAPGE